MPPSKDFRPSTIFTIIAYLPNYRKPSKRTLEGIQAFSMRTLCVNFLVCDHPLPPSLAAFSRDGTFPACPSECYKTSGVECVRWEDWSVSTSVPPDFQLMVPDYWAM